MRPLRLGVLPVQSSWHKNTAHTTILKRCKENARYNTLCEWFCNEIAISPVRHELESVSDDGYLLACQHANQLAFSTTSRASSGRCLHVMSLLTSSVSNSSEKNGLCWSWRLCPVPVSSPAMLTGFSLVSHLSEYYLYNAVWWAEVGAGLLMSCHLYIFKQPSYCECACWKDVGFDIPMCCSFSYCLLC